MPFAKSAKATPKFFGASSGALGRMESSMKWPSDADGDVLRRLEVNGFDFSESHAVDYNIDFKAWPPAPAALEILRSLYGAIEVFEPDEDGDGYVLIQVTGPVTYESVTAVQLSISTSMRPYGGICESWGVAH
jgi:hypothetical protein